MAVQGDCGKHNQNFAGGYATEDYARISPGREGAKMAAWEIPKPPGGLNR
jgi:hypothetical protein